MVNDTICALATAPGGALGIIRVSGPHAFDAIGSLCQLSFDNIKAPSIHYTHIVAPISPDAVSSNQAIIDECCSLSSVPPTATLERTRWKSVATALIIY